MDGYLKNEKDRFFRLSFFYYIKPLPDYFINSIFLVAE